MFYMSSSSLKNRYINDTVRQLAEEGIKNIELSGGTEYYDGFMDDLVELKEKNSLNYLIHNYFPPQENDYVVNLASCNDMVYEASIRHCKNAMGVAVELGSNKYGVHAGFLVDPQVGEIGRPFSGYTLSDRSEALKRFAGAIKELWEYAVDKNIKLYVENNVLSEANCATYEGENPFLLVSSVDFHEFRKMVDFDLLLDIAHLKVSSASLGLSFEDELGELMEYTDYVHLSDNNGLEDENRSLETDSDLWGLLAEHDISEKTITLEVNETLERVVENYHEAYRVLSHGGGTGKKGC